MSEPANTQETPYETFIRVIREINERADALECRIYSPTIQRRRLQVEEWQDRERMMEARWIRMRRW